MDRVGDSSVESEEPPAPHSFALGAGPIIIKLWHLDAERIDARGRQSG
jgi:hypothetical protein